MRPSHLFVFSVLLSASAALLAQGKTAPAGIVTGHVLCGDNNAPARLASVMLEPADAIDGYTAASKGVSAHLSGVQTAPDGSFVMTHVAPGTYYVFASLPGYVSPIATLDATADQLQKPDKALKEKIARVVPRVTVQSGAPAAIDVTLQRGAAVSGTVLYDDGSPAPGLPVQLLIHQKDKWVEPRGGPVPNAPSATTDDRGQFRINGLPAQEYLLAVQLHVAKTSYDVNPNGFGFSSEGDYQIPVYSGSKLRTRDAAPFSIKLGEERTGEDVTVPLGKLHSVSGSLVAARDGHGLNGGQVRLLHADDRSELATTRLSKDDTGWTLSFVPEGDYILSISDGADVNYEEVANQAGSVPPTHTVPHVVHIYAAVEQPCT